MNENMLFARSRHNCLLLSLRSFEKKRKTGAKVMDDNLIWVASDYRDTGGLACLYHDTFGRNAYFQQ
jgi:hypothetical protein